MAEAADKPLSPAMRVVRVAFACLLVLSLLFCITMAAWGELRDAMFVRFLDTRYAKSLVIRAPAGAKVWLGEKYLGEAQYPIIVDSEPEAVIDGLTVKEARVYAEEKTLLQQAVVAQPGDAIGPLLARLAKGRTVVSAGRERLAGGNEFVPLVMREGEHDDAALLCALVVPQRDGPSITLAFLLRLELEGVRLIEGCDLKSRTTQLAPNPDNFWATRTEYEGLPEKVHGQLRTSWLFWPKLAAKDAQAAVIKDPKWVGLPSK